MRPESGDCYYTQCCFQAHSLIITQCVDDVLEISHSRLAADQLFVVEDLKRRYRMLTFNKDKKNLNWAAPSKYLGFRTRFPARGCLLIPVVAKLKKIWISKKHKKCKGWLNYVNQQCWFTKNTNKQRNNRSSTRFQILKSAEKKTGGFVCQTLSFVLYTR